MPQDFERKLLSYLNNASETDSPIVISQKGETLAVVLSASDYQKFQAESEARLESLKQKLDGILALVQEYTQQRTLEDIQAQLVALRKKIEQEMSE